MRPHGRLRGHHQASEDRWEAMRALSSRPFCSCDGRRVSLGDLSARSRYTTDLTQGGGTFTNTWDDMEVFINTRCPNHQVVNGVLVDDSCSFFAADCGAVYFDNLVIGDQTLDDHKDTAP